MSNDTVNRHLREVGAGEFDGGAGTGAANIWTDNGDAILLRQTGILTVGKTYRMTVDFWDNGGALKFRNFANNVAYATLNGTGFKVVYFVAVDTGICFLRSLAEATDCTIDNVSIIEASKHECVVLAGERIKCVVSAGGDTKNGALAIISG